MDIYEATHTGEPITSEIFQNGLRDEDRFQGSFSREKLADLLEQPNCVGLRFYNAGGLTLGLRQLVVVGVTPDGGELRSDTGGKGYFISNTTQGGPEFQLTMTDATNAVNHTQEARAAADRQRFNFSSFFSRAAIENLLVPAAIGIHFFIVDLDATFMTHLAVSSDGLNRIGGQPGELPIHIICDNPCPNAKGGCAMLDPVPGVNTQPIMDTTKYLVIW